MFDTLNAIIECGKRSKRRLKKGRMLAEGKAFRLTDQIKIDSQDDPERGDILTHVKAKHGNLELAIDGEEHPDSMRLELGIDPDSAVDDSMLKKLGYAPEAYSSGEVDAKLWWNDKLKKGLLEVNNGDFGCWVLRK